MDNKIKIIKIDVGNAVYCDFCGDDYTNSPDQGGLMFGSKATCPKCVPKIESSSKRYGEEHFIRSRCPEGKSFANWVREDLR